MGVDVSLHENEIYSKSSSDNSDVLIVDASASERCWEYCTESSSSKLLVSKLNGFSSGETVTKVEGESGPDNSLVLIRSIAQHLKAKKTNICTTMICQTPFFAFEIEILKCYGN